MPKSWVLFTCAILVGLLVFGPIAAIAVWIDIHALFAAAQLGFFASWAIAAVMWLVGMFGLLTGKHRNLQPRPWKEQVW
jgi:hypothetical protein